MEFFLDVFKMNPSYVLLSEEMGEDLLFSFSLAYLIISSLPFLVLFLLTDFSPHYGLYLPAPLHDR